MQVLNNLFLEKFFLTKITKCNRKFEFLNNIIFDFNLALLHNIKLKIITDLNRDYFERPC